MCMKNLKILLGLLLIASVVVSCDKKTTAKNDTADVDTTLYNVKTLTLSKQEISQNVNYTANLLPYQEINYAPASPGRVEEILVEVGSRVSKGQVIARMDKTQLQQANDQYQNARSNFQRMDTLYKLNSMSKQNYEAAKTAYEVSRSSVDFLSRNTTLVSPISGVVTGKYFENGEFYSGSPNTPAGKAALVTLMQINPLKVTVNVSERYFPITHKGLKATFKVDIYPNRTFSGEISKVYPTINSETRTFPVEIVIKNNDEALRPGMFARVNLDLGKTRAMLLPAIAVVKQEGTNDRYVFKALSNNTVSKIRIEIGQRFNDQLEVISNDIHEGDLIVVAGQEKLMDNSRIKIVK
jgi:membrane fusion protein, multidrug efflux system